MTQPGKEEKKSFWKSFVNFLAYGGIMVILIGIAGIVILVSYLSQ